MAKVSELQLQHQSFIRVNFLYIYFFFFSISFRIEWFDLLAVQGTLKSLLQHHSLTASILWGLFYKGTNSRSLLKLRSIESVMPFNHLILCHPLLLLPSIFPSIKVFSIESVLHIRWPKRWSFSFSISPFNEYSGLISFRTDWLGLSRVFTIQKHQFFSAQPSS